MKLRLLTLACSAFTVVAILLGLNPCFTEQPLRLGELSGAERRLSQCLVGRRA